MKNFERPFTFDRVVRLLITLAIFIGLFLLIRSIKGALLPFLIGWLLAYMINPLVEFCQNRVGIKSRILSIVISLLTILVVFGGAIALISPYLSQEMMRFVHLLERYRNESGEWTVIPASWIEFINNNIDFDQLIQQINREDIMQIADRIGFGIRRVASGSLTVIFGITVTFLILLYTIFILIDYDRIIAGFKNLIPPKFRYLTLNIFNDVKVSMNRYFRGQALVALTVGILYAIGFKIIDLPLGIALGLFIGLLNIVPYLQILGYLPALMLCLLKAGETGQNFWLIALSAIVVLVSVQIIQDSFIVPKIMGRITGLNPAVILLSLSVWGSLLGFVGLVIALPMTTLLVSYYQRVTIDGEMLYREDPGGNDQQKDKPEEE